MAADAQEPTPFPAQVLLLSVGGVLSVIGAFLPWVSAGALFTVTGVEANWGLLALFIGLLGLAIGVQLASGRLVRRTLNRPLAFAGVCLGILAVGAALYVGFAVRGAIADSESESSSSSEDVSTGVPEFDASLQEFGDAIEEAFKVQTGSGVYLTVLSGVLMSAGGAIALRRIANAPSVAGASDGYSPPTAPRRSLRGPLVVSGALATILVLAGAGIYFGRSSEDPPQSVAPAVGQDSNPDEAIACTYFAVGSEVGDFSDALTAWWDSDPEGFDFSTFPTDEAEAALAVMEKAASAEGTPPSLLADIEAASEETQTFLEYANGWELTPESLGIGELASALDNLQASC